MGMLLGQSTTETALNWTVLLPVVAGALAVWYLLPTPRRRPLRFGLLALAVTVFGIGAFLCRGLQADLPFNAEAFLFWAFGLLAITFAMLMVTQRNPARAAIFFAVVVMSTCGLFLLQAAPFLMAASIIVYAGAIVVTFLFVIMLSQQTGQSDANDRSREPSLAAATGFILLGTLLVVLQRAWTVREMDELIQRAGQYATADVVDPSLTDPARARAFLADVERVRERRGYSKLKHRIPNLVIGGDELRPKDSDPVEELRDALGLNPGIPSMSGEDEPIEPDAVDVKIWCRRIHYELAYLKALHDGRVEAPIDDVVRSPHGLARHPDAPRHPADIPPRNLPNANIAALGRTLFTDHLLAIELGGTLLLIATIGAIAIAGTRKETAA
jgi:NADH-quinone oxidoreductase subunit J